MLPTVPLVEFIRVGGPAFCTGTHIFFMHGHAACVDDDEMNVEGWLLMGASAALRIAGQSAVGTAWAEHVCLCKWKHIN